MACIAFGVAALAWPQRSAIVLVGLFGAYALIDGIMSLLMAARGRGLRAHGWLALVGGVSVAAGLASFEQPRLMALILVRIIGVWLMARGLGEILGERALREDPDRRDWNLLLNGAMTAIFGVGLTLSPRIGGLGLMWATGLWAILHGVFMASFAVRLRRSDPFL